MRHLIIAIALLVLLGTSLWATPPSRPWAEPEAPVGCEIVDKVPKDGKIQLLLHVQAGECFQSVDITWYSWSAFATSDATTIHQPVNGANVLDIPITMRLPEPNTGSCALTVRTIHMKVPTKGPCVQKREYIGTRGKKHTARREVSKEEEYGVKRFTFQITDSSVFLTSLLVTRDYTPQKPDTSMYYTPWINEPAETVRTPTSRPEGSYTPPHEPTEEEKQEIDSILGITPLTKAEKMAKLEEQPLEGMDRQFFELDGVMYVRDRGQRKFRISPSMTTEELEAWARSRAESSATMPPETEFEVRMWLTNPDDLNWAREQFDSLKATDEPDCYITQTTMAVIRQIQKRGIRLRRQEAR